MVLHRGGSIIHLAKALLFLAVVMIIAYTGLLATVHPKFKLRLITPSPLSSVKFHPALSETNQESLDPDALVPYLLPLESQLDRVEPVSVTPPHFAPVFPEDLLDVMRGSCVSIICHSIHREYHQDNFVTAFKKLAHSETARRLLVNHDMPNSENTRWDDVVDVMDLANASIDGEGDVATCSVENQVQNVFGSFGCRESAGAGSCTGQESIIDKVIVISQMWGGNYFHYVVEDMPRIFLAWDYLTKKNESLDGWYIHHQISKPVSEAAAHLFNALGMVHGYVRAHRVLLPSPTNCGGQIANPGIIQLRSLIYKQYKIQPTNQNILARTTLIVFKRQGNKRSIRNHDQVVIEIRRLWGPNKTVIEHDGTGTFMDQMLLYSQAAVLIGPHGAGLTSQIGMQPGSTLVEILPEVGINRLNLCYVVLSFTLGLRYYALRAPGFDAMGTGYLPIESLARLPFWEHTTKNETYLATQQ